MRLKIARTMMGLGLVASVGCGSSDGDAPAGAGAAATAANGALEIFPPKVYSGFGGGGTYQAPVIIHPEQSGTATWTIADPSIATIKRDGNNATFTATKAGDTTITVTINGKSATAPFKVYAYTPAQYMAGMRRYTTPANAQNPACIKCHAAGVGPDHTPTEIDADTDEEIQHTFTTGVDPENRRIKDMPEHANLLKDYPDHKWMVTDEEKTGLLAYMRALTPMDYPEYDAPTTGK